MTEQNPLQTTLELEVGMASKKASKKPTGPRKKQFRFSAKDDVNLLREVAARNPFSATAPKDVWTKIAERLEDVGLITVDGRRARERSILLLDQYQTEDRASLRRSGTEEEYDEKEQLLQEIIELQKEEENAAEKRTAAEQKKEGKLQAEEIRKAAMKRAISDGSKESTPVKKRRTSDSTQEMFVQYLKEKDEKKAEFRLAELEVRRQEADLQRERLDIERRRMELETEERTAMVELLRQKLMQ